uniref:Uncharacterized protein n=1 Tax=Romanomermis culicivorax TaxID=13658 RepID=A0A915I791_ROMCU
MYAVECGPKKCRLDHIKATRIDVKHNVFMHTCSGHKVEGSYMMCMWSLDHPGSQWLRICNC